MPKKFYYGGQAVIEGVMILGQKRLSIAVRRPNNDISVLTKPLTGLHTTPARKIPLIRGIVILIGTLALGIQAITYSANVSLEGEDVELKGGMLWGMLALVLALVIGLFFVIPLLLTNLLDPHISSPLVSNVIDSIIRITIFTLYLAAMNLMPDIRRVFAYHGAEHKTVNAYDSGAPLEVDKIREFPTAHTRCGTAFLLVTLIIAIIVFAFLGRPGIWMRILSRLALLPAIAAVSYEFTRFGARHSNNKIVRALLSPGLTLQKMTTREPDDSQLEVAISALRGAIENDNPEGNASEPNLTPPEHPPDPDDDRNILCCRYDTPDPSA